MGAPDWPDVARIYDEGIAGGNATFETRVPEWEYWDGAHIETCRLVVEEDGDVVAWAALSPVSSRSVYRGVAETSIYVADGVRGRGIGSELLGALVEESEKCGFWTLQTAIFADNEASVSLHARHGFRVVGTREMIGEHEGRWRDTILMERRSRRVGV